MDHFPMRSASSKSTSPRPDDSRAAATHTGLTAVAVQRRGKPDEDRKSVV